MALRGAVRTRAHPLTRIAACAAALSGIGSLGIASPAPAHLSSTLPAHSALAATESPAGQRFAERAAAKAIHRDATSAHSPLAPTYPADPTGHARTARGHLNRAHSAKHTGHKAAGTSKKPKKLVVLVELKHLRHRGTITRSAFKDFRSTYMEALHTISRLSGARRAELAGVLSNVEEIARSKSLTPSRLPVISLTVQRNREWWSTGSLLSYGQRVTFPGSHLVWEYYPGQGIEIQWLGTFGAANGYYLSGTRAGNASLRQILDEAAELASSRAGGIAWEYLFHFDGGSPPWTSGLSQGTAIQALARAATRLHEPGYMKLAEEALGVFNTPPPAGVRVPTKAGASYMEYSFAPTDRILNGFIQAVTGLYDFAKLSGSTTGERLFNEGDAQARIEVPHYVIPGWSMYDQYSLSDLGYHELLTEFLRNLCARTRTGEPIPPPTPEAGETGGVGAGESPGSPAPGGSSSAPAGAGGGGNADGKSEGPASAHTARAQAAGDARIANTRKTTPHTHVHARSARTGRSATAPAGTPIAGDEVYCATAALFESDLDTPPTLRLLSHTIREGFRAGVRFSLSAPSTVTLTVRKAGGDVVWTNRASLRGGKPRMLWVTPRHGGVYKITLTAVDLAGNTGSTSGTVRLTQAKRP